MKTRLLLAEDHLMFRQSLRILLEQETDIAVVGEVGDGMELLRCVTEIQPDVVCMDIGLPGLDGIEATRRLRSIAPNIKIVGLSTHTDKHFILEMLHAGALGYVTKNEAGEELLRAIRAVRLGRTYLGPRVAETVADALLNRDGSRAAAPVLSSRESQVLRLVTNGNTSTQIAEQLFISPATVDVHRRNIMRKLNLHSVADLTRYAIRHGLITNRLIRRKIPSGWYAE